MSLYDALQKAVTWATVTRAQDANGTVQVDAGGPRPLERILQLGLPGAYAVAKAGVTGVLFRLLSNGLFFAADTKPPGDATTGEVGWIIRGTLDALVRLLPTGIFEVKGTPIIGGISLGAADGTDLGPAPLGPLPAVGVPGLRYAVGRSGDTVQLGSTPIGNLIASTTRTIAS